MEAILPHALAQQPAIVNFLKDLVECESPSDDAAAVVNRFVDLVAARVDGLARVKTFPGGRFGRNLLLTFDLPGPRKKKRDRFWAWATVIPCGRWAHWRRCRGGKEGVCGDRACWT
ncbi:MAG: hypothetical protein QM757_24485 [Paludibaculum sp.]